MWVLAWAACTTSTDVTEDGGEPALPDDSDTPTVPLPTGDTGAPPDTDPPADTADTGTQAPDPCAIDPAMAITAVGSSQPWKENEAEITVTLSTDGTAAVVCTAVFDPTEIHLVESTVLGTDHVIRLPGLVGGQTYDCEAAPTCPEMAASPTAFSFTSVDEPGILPYINTTTYIGAPTGYALLNHSDDCTWDDQRLVVADRNGMIRWYHVTPPFVGPSIEFRYHGDDLFVWGGGWGPNALGRPRRIDLYDGQIYDSADAIADVNDSAFHHDGKQLPDGRMLTLEQVPVDVGQGTFDGFRVRRIDPVTNTVDFDYHSQRGYDEGFLPAGFGDAWHANWSDIVDDGNGEKLYVSLCYLGWTVAIDVATGDFLWAFGSGGDFSLVDAAGAPLSSSEFPQCQHGIESSGSNLLIYDNGNWGRYYSRIAEYALDTVAMEATMLWTWSEPDWWESTLGDADWMDNGHVWIGAGHSDCFSSNPGDRTTVLEIDPLTGDKVWELQYAAAQAMAYRADYADGCALFANTRECPDLAARLLELQPIFTR